MPPENDKTITFSLKDEKDLEVKRVLLAVYSAIAEKGTPNPISQIAGYLMSDEPAYITSYKNARSLIRKVDRDEILSVLLKSYLGV